MAAKVGRLKAGQLPTAEPYKRVKTSVADLLVRRLWCERLHKGLIRDLEIKPARKASDFVIAKQYIPEKMPPRDVPGCFFEEPQSDTWQLEHKTVTFMARKL